MASQIIILDGVTSPGGSGPAIDMTPADFVAADMSSLILAASGRDPGNFQTDAFRSRLNGEAFQLFTTGTADPFNVTTLGGKPAIVSPGTALARALVSPAGLFNSGLTVVSAVYLDAESVSTGADTNFFSVLDENNARAVVFNPVRYAGGADSFRFNATGATSIVDSTAGWKILISDFSPIDPAVSNVVDVRFALNAMPGAPVAVTLTGLTTSYRNPSFAIGHPSGSIGLRNCGIGDMYVFDESLGSTAAGTAKLSSLLSALKSQYGIA